jgi:hypothetical protein
MQPMLVRQSDVFTTANFYDDTRLAVQRCNWL